MHRLRSCIVFAAFAILLTGCAGSTTRSGGSESDVLSDRELAWCLQAPGGVGAIASNTGIDIPPAAQAAVDDGMYDNATRWRYHDAWGADVYRGLCQRAYVQFGGADGEVDLSILEPGARQASPSPTANISTADLRVRARDLMPSLAARISELDAAIGSRLPSAVEDAASALVAITSPELDALTDAVADSCFEDAGAAYGLALSWADSAAYKAIEWADGGAPGSLDLAAEYLTDAAKSVLDFDRLDSQAEC